MREKHFAAIVQANAFTRSTYPLIVVMAMTSTRPKNSVGWLQLEPSAENGLAEVTYLDAKKLYTIPNPV